MKKLIMAFLFFALSYNVSSQRLHTDKKAGFEIKIPDDWDKQKIKNSGHKLLAFFKNKETKKPEARLYLTVADYKTVNQDSIVYNYEKNQKHHYPTYKIVESTIVEIENRKFYRITSEHEIPEGVFKNLSFISSGDGKWIVMDFGTYNNSFEKFYNKFEEVASSFKLLAK